MIVKINKDNPLIALTLCAENRPMVSEESQKEKAQRAVKSLKGRMSQREIAEATGLTHAVVRNFSWNRVISPPDFERLERWLDDTGLLENIPAAEEEPDDYGVSRVRNIVACPSCKQPAPQDFDGKIALFCCHCGEQIFIECPNPKCGTSNALHADYCRLCNTPLHDDAANAEIKAATATRDALKNKTERARDRDRIAQKKGQPGF